MTSGEFTSFSLDRIWVDREKRQRRELHNIDDLAESIQRLGLIHPLVISREGELIAGERRLTAIRQLGWTAVSVQFADELNELQLQEIEYEENARRSDLTWQEDCLAVARLHELKQKLDPAWNKSDTAQLLNAGNSTVTAKLAVAKQILVDKRVAEAPKYSTARSIVERTQRRKVDSQLAEADGLVPSDGTAPRTAPLLNADFTEWSAAHTGNRFNFIHCDFPYGERMHESDQGGRAAFGSYEDDVDTYWRLLQTLDAAMSNVVADSAHLMFWFSMKYYADTKLALEKMGWRVEAKPLIWVKSDNVGILADAKRGPRHIYETAFFASRGDRLIVQPISNVCSHPSGDKAVHMNEKPRGMLRHFFRMFIDEYSTMLDPTCGSANAVWAANALGAPTVLGLERDPEFFNRAKEHYYEDDAKGNGLDL